MRWLLPSLLAVCLCSCGKKDKDRGGEPPGETSAAKPEVTALLEFWDTSLNEHVYTYGDGEPANWRGNPKYNGEKIVGYVATKQYPDTVPLQRAFCKDQRHYFYINKPAAANDIERMEDFKVYVWATAGDGRVPVHACFLPDEKDAYFDQDLKRVKDYVEGTLKGIGKQRRLAENYFYVYPTGPAPKKSPAPPPVATPASPDSVVGMWLGQVGNRTVMVRYYADGYFEESPTGSSADAIYGTYTVQTGANQRLEIRRDVGGNVTPEFQNQVSMVHPIGPSGERVPLRKVSAPATDTSPLKQKPLSPEAEALRKRLVGRWKPAFAGNPSQAQFLEYRADGTFTYTITPPGRAESKVSGRWVVVDQSKGPQTGRPDGLTLSRFVDGKMISVARLAFTGDSHLSHNLYGGKEEQAVFVPQK